MADLKRQNGCSYNSMEMLYEAAVCGWTGHSHLESHKQDNLPVVQARFPHKNVKDFVSYMVF